ncbi:S-adenosyl-L-methionine-dependent methyltransferase [Ochromonadaceae sp. CCMP2298]|nr:S-adenosyl-L-methionine-dependent methyltransferase [Ochromonadaceae sp. CCMP2298]|mmetsp:Transcript_10603/g.23533  ORF Transcript_10603/g.23533 Transcript_10603/m.23533 type:complete len:341 (+) Transcript_10603:30-1052(+)
MASFKADDKTRFSARDSLACKFSASRFNYFKDPFIESIYEGLNRTNGVLANVRRSPIIHRGYFARSEGFAKVLELFLERTSAAPSRQVVFLGPGFDTSPLIPYVSGAENVHTFEVDFPDIMSKKVELYRAEPEIVSLLEKGTQADAEATTGTPSSSIVKMGPLSFIAQDLRRAEAVTADLVAAGLRGDVPTLVLSECVLVYVAKAAVLDLCHRLGSLLQDAVWLTYDMITPNDVYGRNMIKNLEAAGFDIPGIRDFPSLEQQQSRFLETGWGEVRSCTMQHYFDSVMPGAQKERVCKLEMLDEVEEFNLLMSHYSLTLACKGESASTAAILDFIPQAAPS